MKYLQKLKDIISPSIFIEKVLKNDMFIIILIINLSLWY